MVDRAADNVIEALDSQMYKVWHKKAMGLIGTLENGLSKLDFGTDIPESIKKIQSLIQQANQAQNQDRKKLLDIIKKLSAELSDCQNKIDLGDVQANNFIFQAKRSFDWFNYFLITEYGKYAQAFINPSGKASEKGKSLGFIPDFLINQGAKTGMNQVGHLFDFHIGSLFTEQVKNMRSVKIDNPSDRTKQTGQKNLLSKLGREKYKIFSATSELNSVEDGSKYLAQKIYGFSFEFYYSQVAMYLDMLHNIEEIAKEQKDPKLIKDTRLALLKKMGIEQIDTPEGKAFLDKVSKNLGFENAQSVYENYVSLSHSDQAFDNLVQAKKAFCDFAVKDEGFREQDPINKIKELYSAEYHRVQDNKKDNEFYSGSATYIAALSYVATDFYLAIDGIRGVKNIVGIAAQEKVAPMIGPPEQRNILVRAAVGVANFAANNLKDYIDVNYYMGLNQHGVLIEQKLEDARGEIEEQLLNIKLKKNKARLEVRAKLFDKMTTQEIKKKDLITEFEQSYVTHSDAAHQDYRAAFEIKLALKCQGKGQKALEKSIDSLNKQVQDATELKGRVTIEQTVFNERKTKFEKKEASFGGRIKRGFDRFLGWFGIKTKSAIKRENEQLYLKEQAVNIADKSKRIEGRIKGLNKMSGMVKEQLNRLSVIEKSDPNDILKEFKKNIDKLERLNQAIVEEYKGKADTEIDRVLVFQTQYLSLQNNLLLDKQAILHKLPQLTLMQLNSLMKEADRLSEYQKKLNPKLIGLTQSVGDFYVNKMQDYPTALKKQYDILHDKNQKMLLSEYQNNINSWVAENSFIDLKTLLDGRPENLTPDYLEVYDQFVQEKLVQMLKIEQDSLSISELEQIAVYLSKLSYINPELKLYQNILSDVGYQINHKYLVSTQSGFEAHRDLFLESTDSLSQKFKNLNQIKTHAEKVKSTNESWLWNPFGFSTQKKKLQEAESALLAHQDFFKISLTRCLAVTQDYMDHRLSEYQARPIVELESDIDLIGQNIKNLQDILNSSFPSENKIILEDLIFKYQQLHEKLKLNKEHYFENKLKDNAPLDILTLAQGLVEAAGKGDTDLLNKIIGNRQDMVLPEADIRAALQKAISENQPETVKWILTHLDLSLDAALVNELLTFYKDDAMLISDYERGWGQLAVDNDGKVLKLIRQAFNIQAKFQQDLDKKLQVIKDPLLLNNIMQEQARMIHLREQMVSVLRKQSIDNPIRVDAQLSKWEAEVHTMESHTAKRINSIVNKGELFHDIESEHAEIEGQHKVNHEIEQRTQYFKLKNKLNKHVEKAYWNTSKFKLILSKLAKVQKDAPIEIQSDYMIALQNTLEGLIAKSEIDSIEVLLDMEMDPKQKDTLFEHALFHAIELGQVKVLDVVLLYKIDFSKDHNQLSQDLLARFKKIQDEKLVGGANSKHVNLDKMVAVVLPQLPLSYSSVTHDLIRAVVKKDFNEKKYGVEQHRFQYIDKDKPLLDLYRNGYLFADNAMKELQDECFYDLWSPFEQEILLVKEPKDMTEDEVHKFETRLKAFQDRLNAMKGMVIQLKSAHCDFLNQLDSKKNANWFVENKVSPLGNHDRLKSHLKNWDAQLEASIDLQQAKAQEHINDIQKYLQEYQQAHQNMPFRKSVLFQSAVAEPDEPVIHEPVADNALRAKPSSDK